MPGGKDSSSDSDVDSVENFDGSPKQLRPLPKVVVQRSSSESSDSSAEVQRAIAKDESESETSSDSISQANSRARTAQSPPASKASSPARTARSPSSPLLEAAKPDVGPASERPTLVPAEAVDSDVARPQAEAPETRQLKMGTGLCTIARHAFASVRQLQLPDQDAHAAWPMLSTLFPMQDLVQKEPQQELPEVTAEDSERSCKWVILVKLCKAVLTNTGSKGPGNSSLEFIAQTSDRRWMNVEGISEEGPLGSAYSLSLTIVILVNVASFMLSTEPSMTQHQPVPVTYTLIVAIRLLQTTGFYPPAFDRIETITVCIFTVEYVIRFSTQAGSCLARIRWVFTNFFSIVDLVSIMPFYVDLLIPGEQKYLATQWVRVARLLRLLPPLPYDVIWQKSYKLLMASGFAGCTVWVICAALYYWFEKDNADMLYCPDDLDKEKGLCWNRFHSIPAAMYYSLLNFFGEFPLADKHSLGGRFVGGFIQVMGAAVMAIPAGALGNAFSEVVEKELSAKKQDAIGVDLCSLVVTPVVGRKCLQPKMMMPLQLRAARTLTCEQVLHNSKWIQLAAALTGCNCAMLGRRARGINPAAPTARSFTDPAQVVMHRIADVTVDMADIWFSLLARSLPSLSCQSQLLALAASVFVRHSWLRHPPLTSY
ncbi:KCND2 [Symbiodinium pilosum]|uniref:KCND2 protein n=1 Tax=Symbiodinium pilosum TaxID=2952 RepID=A0A812SPT4_SYMPI|nr:KCND2 [Symbiodinium pilosum]